VSAVQSVVACHQAEGISRGTALEAVSS
jgi:hypothetical protein